MGLKKTLPIMAFFVILIVLEGELVAGWSFHQTNMPREIWLLLMVSSDVLGITCIYMGIGLLTGNVNWVEADLENDNGFKFYKLVLCAVLAYIVGMTSEIIGSTFLWTYNPDTVVILYFPFTGWEYNGRAVAHWMLYTIMAILFTKIVLYFPEKIGFIRS
jgi:hypothetical protein